MNGFDTLKTSHYLHGYIVTNLSDKTFIVNGSIASPMTSKREPVIWLCVLVTLAYMKGRSYVPTYERS